MLTDPGYGKNKFAAVSAGFCIRVRHDEAVYDESLAAAIIGHSIDLSAASVTAIGRRRRVLPDLWPALH